MNYQAFFKLTYGLYLLTSRDGDKLNGHVNNTVFQVTAEPPRVIAATHKNNLTTEFIRKSSVFAISIIQENVTLDFLGPWGFKSGKDINKFEKTDFFVGKTGAPIVRDKCIAWIECEVESSIEIGTHVLFVGKVVDGDVMNDEEKPLTYSYYREKIKGISPENAPTYIKQKQQPKVVSDEKPAEPERQKGTPVGRHLKKYRCVVCGHVYDPEEGDPSAGIPPGTAWEDVPENWTCPICGVTKEDFVELD